MFFSGHVLNALCLQFTRSPKIEKIECELYLVFIPRQDDIGRFNISSHRSLFRLKVTIGAICKLAPFFCFYAAKSLILFRVLRFPEERVRGQAKIKRPTARFEPVVSRGTPGFEADALTSWLRAQVEKYVAPGMSIEDEHCPQYKYDGGHVKRL